MKSNFLWVAMKRTGIPVREKELYVQSLDQYITWRWKNAVSLGLKYFFLELSYSI